MSTHGTLSRLIGVTAGLLVAGSVAAQSRFQTNKPAAYGTTEYTVTYVPAMAFFPFDSFYAYHTSGGLARYGDVNIDQHFYAPVDIPQGAVIDFIGFNNLNDGTAGVMTLSLHDRESSGSTFTDLSVACTSHTSWSTDFSAGPAGVQWVFNDPGILEVHALSSPNQQFIGHAEVWWHLQVSPAPASATFTDVPTTSPIFQYVEALASSGITAGCGGGNYCPNNPVTRGQMAVFLAKALGLNWGSSAAP
ncbi:MAG TPA: S-layer homology domain-containing protein [Thermoanaerobaculia bacterium]|jgi:hypothetical protein|nr:S-layer homology domain-containing protein [Thermoanaerobaculia bacterium]